MQPSTINKGTLVASSYHLEWLLPWWWYYYNKHSTLPVAFVDLGLSSKMQQWCRTKGTLIQPNISLPSFEQTTLEPQRKQAWVEVLGPGVLEVRKQWFKKIGAFLASPFENTLWMDLDCEVRSDITPLFTNLTKDVDVVLAKEPPALQQGFQSLGFSLPNEIIYNTGVVLYRAQSPFLLAWEEEIKQRHHLHIGDQEALSRVFLNYPFPKKDLDPLWNWDRGLGPNPKAHIFHWHGEKGKKILRDEIHTLNTLGMLA